MKQGNLEFKARLGYIVRSCLKKSRAGQAWWLIPVIPASQEAEIRRLKVQDSISTNSWLVHTCHPAI
jgi:hypothetical protein